MPKQPPIMGLDDFGLTPATLSRLGPRPVGLTIQLSGEKVSRLWNLKPRQRDSVLRATLAKQLGALKRGFPKVEFVSRARDKPSWTIDATVPAREVVKLAARSQIKYLTLKTVEGRQQKLRRSRLIWFCVWGVVAIQIEGLTKGSLDLEDRLVLVKAKDPDDAQRRLLKMWKAYAEPYMNPHGYLVRWQLMSIRDVYELFDETIEPRGTEVFSKLKRVRMRREYRWHPRREAGADRARK